METTRDAFLGGRLNLVQPKSGFRAGTDTVYLAAAIRAEAGQSVLEFGCGSGVALACLNHRIAGLRLTGIEREAEYAALARENNPDAVIIEADVLALPPTLKAQSFDHIFMNPPFFEATRHSPPPNALRAKAHVDEGGLSDWISTAYKRLTPNGSLTIIHISEALPDILRAMTRFGNIRVLPLQGATDKPPRRVIIRGERDRKGAFRLLAPHVLQDENGGRTKASEAVARHAAPLGELYLT